MFQCVMYGVKICKGTQNASASKFNDCTNHHGQLVYFIKRNVNRRVYKASVGVLCIVSSVCHDGVLFLLNDSYYLVVVRFDAAHLARRDDVRVFQLTKHEYCSSLIFVNCIIVVDYCRGSKRENVIHVDSLLVPEVVEWDAFVAQDERGNLFILAGEHIPVAGG